jgi:hypothetical protein
MNEIQVINFCIEDFLFKKQLDSTPEAAGDLCNHLKQQ